MVKSLRRRSAVKSARLHTPTELLVGPRQQSPLSPSNHSPVVIISPSIVVIMSYMAPAPQTQSTQLLRNRYSLLTLSSTLTIRPPAVSSPHPHGGDRCTPARYTATAPPLPQVLVPLCPPRGYDGAHPRFSTSVCVPAAPQCLHEPLGPHNDGCRLSVVGINAQSR